MLLGKNTDIVTLWLFLIVSHCLLVLRSFLYRTEDVAGIVSDWSSTLGPGGSRLEAQLGGFKEGPR